MVFYIFGQGVRFLNFMSSVNDSNHILRSLILMRKSSFEVENPADYTTLFPHVVRFTKPIRRGHSSHVTLWNQQIKI